MNTITIIVVVVVALVTVAVLSLAWLAYLACVKTYYVETNQGMHDEEIYKEFHNEKKNKSEIVGHVGFYLISMLLLSLFITGIIYKASNETFSINNQTVLVIKSGSMSDFYSNSYKETIRESQRGLQFDVGDICFFEKINNQTTLNVGEVYGYRYKNIIITHRLIEVNEKNCLFRGDNNAVEDLIFVAEGKSYSTTRDKVLYHYTGKKIQGLGAFILYAQSYFGIWSLCFIIGIIISSEIIHHKINNINKKRYEKLVN